MIEEWKNIEWYSWVYQISNLWRVKSFKYGKEKILKWWKKIWWYSEVSLCNWIIHSYTVSRLVAIYFIPNPFNLPLACHKDETLDENGLLYNWKDNLYWGTQSDNMKDKFKKWRANNSFQLRNPRTALWKFWKYHNCSKIVYQFNKQLKLIKKWNCFSDVTRELWIANSSISRCCKWTLKSAWWYIWKFNI